MTAPMYGFPTWIPILVLLAFGLFLYYALRGRGIAWWLLVPIVVTSSIGALVLFFVAFQILIAIFADDATADLPKLEGPRQISGLAYAEAREAARNFGMECKDLGGNGFPVLGFCKSDIEDNDSRYEVDVLGNEEKVGAMEVYARGCGEGNFDRTEAVDLLGTMAALAFEDEVLSENARRWVEQHASTEGGVKTVSGIQLNFSADCGATLGSMHLSVRANGYVPGM